MKNKSKGQHREQVSLTEMQIVQSQTAQAAYCELPSFQQGCGLASAYNMQVSIGASANTKQSADKNPINNLRSKKIKILITSIILVTFVTLVVLWNAMDSTNSALTYWDLFDQQDMGYQQEQIAAPKLSTPTVNNIEKYQTLIKRKFNPENSGKVFGSQKQFGVKINYPILEQQYIDMLKQHDIYSKIQVGSLHDYANLSSSIDYRKVTERLSKSIAYEEYSFIYDKTQQKSSYILELNKFKNDGIPDQQKYRDLGLDMKGQFFELYLGALITRNPLGPEVKQAEYHYYDSKYQLSKQTQERPICVYASGYKVFSKNRYEQFFTTLQRQNYTNFHVVYVDDNSPQQQTESLAKYLQQQRYRLNNRLKLIHTTQHLGALANMYFFINKLCKPNDIVINIDADDALIGHQALKVVNHFYKEESVWFAYSRYILAKDMERRNLQIGFSAKLRVLPQNYRNQFTFWDVSHLRTFRKKLFQKVPLYMMMEYHVNQGTGIAYPYFYNYAADAFQIFALLELTGTKNYEYMSDFLYLYYGSASNPGKNCYPKHEKFDDFKSRIKTPLKKLQSLDEEAKQADNFTIPVDTWNTFRSVQNEYVKCLNS